MHGPVTETMERDEVYTVMTPVTTYRAVTVDQGTYVDQQTVVPGRVVNRLQWVPGLRPQSRHGPIDLYESRPDVGAAEAARRGDRESGLAAERRHAANPANQHGAAAASATKVPFQVCRVVNEEVVRKVPFQVCRMVAEEQVRKVPVTVCRQVTERVERQVPVQTCKMVPELVVRKIPVQTTRMVCEERVDQVPVQVCRMVCEQRTVQVPRCVETRTPVVYTYRVPARSAARCRSSIPAATRAAIAAVAAPPRSWHRPPRRWERSSRVPCRACPRASAAARPATNVRISGADTGRAGHEWLAPCAVDRSRGQRHGRLRRNSISPAARSKRSRPEADPAPRRPVRRGRKKSPTAAMRPKTARGLSRINEPAPGA